MLTKQFDFDDIRKVFTRQKIMTLQDIRRFLGCSARTVQRRLQSWPTHTSYNANGRYYTLGFIPRFNKDGLWHYKKISFSRYGNLRETVIRLVHNSEAGLTGRQLGELTQLVPSSFLFHFQDDVRWRREKAGGSYVYFSSIESLYHQQQNRRLTQLRQLETHRLPTDAEAVLILVERIRHPDLDSGRLSVRLKGKGFQIGRDSIHHLFIRHGLVKKTEHTQP